MFLTVSMAVIIAWIWLLYLCMPLRPTRWQVRAMLLETRTDGFDMRLIVIVVNRIRLFLRTTQPSMTSASVASPICASSLLASAMRSSSDDVHNPSPSKQKYRAEARKVLVGDHFGDHERNSESGLPSRSARGCRSSYRGRDPAWPPPGHRDEVAIAMFCRRRLGSRRRRRDRCQQLRDGADEMTWFAVNRFTMPSCPVLSIDQSLAVAS